jgi:hypothetical protein
LSTDRVVEFLAEPKNVRYACEVYQAFPKVLERLKQRFWGDVLKRLHSPFSKLTQWRLESSEKGDDPSISLLPKSLSPAKFDSKPIQFYYCLEQLKPDTEFFRIWLGLAVNVESLSKNWKPRNQLAVELIEDLQELGYKSRPDWTWIAYQEYDYGQQDRSDAAEQLASLSLSAEFAGKFLDFVTEYADQLERINKSLRGR